MKVVSKSFYVGLLIWALSIAAVSAKSAPKPEQTPINLNSDLAQAFVEQWFSIDTREPLNLSQSSIQKTPFGSRRTLRFSSDDGQAVNGMIASPSNQIGADKLALVLHPMGTDQNFWWSDKSPLEAHKLTQLLLRNGYTVLSLDARAHGERSREGFGPRELLKRAHSDAPRIYIDTIIGSVRDYRIALNWARESIKPKEVMVVGYSMGAQMSLLLSAFEPTINHVIAMVPPFVGSPTSPVAPRQHNHRIRTAAVLWLAGNNDPHSAQQDTQLAFDQIQSSKRSLVWFESGHRLPVEYLDAVANFIESIQQGGAQ